MSRNKRLWAEKYSEYLRAQEEAEMRFLEKLRHLKAPRRNKKIKPYTYTSPDRMHAQNKPEKNLKAFTLD